MVFALWQQFHLRLSEHAPQFLSAAPNPLSPMPLIFSSPIPSPSFTPPPFTRCSAISGQANLNRLPNNAFTMRAPYLVVGARSLLNGFGKRQVLGLIPTAPSPPLTQLIISGPGRATYGLSAVTCVCLSHVPGRFTVSQTLAYSLDVATLTLTNCGVRLVTVRRQISRLLSFAPDSGEDLGLELSRRCIN